MVSRAMYATGDYIKAEFRDEQYGDSEWMWVKAQKRLPQQHFSENGSDLITAAVNVAEGGCPRLTLLSTNASCQLEKPENSQVKAWVSTSTLGVELAPPRCLSSNWRERAARESLRNVADRGERGGGCCCQQNGRFELGQKSSGSPAWIRTTIHGSKGRCPTIRRPGKD